VKCIKNKETGEVKRISDLKAMKSVIDGPWIYVPKHLWKAQRAGGDSNANDK
tara:strand:+ start:744 stop:899 length:156 start_codon:yes stop_codon:yes gene_type:complete